MRNKRDKEQQELNESLITLAAFLESYNQNIPVSFPRATVTTLKKFQETHPMLFRQKDAWSVTRHRKRLIDWLSSNANSS